MKKDYGQSAEKLVQALGGKDNITRVFHCMTRLRFYVKDRNRIKEGDIKKLPEISGVNWHQDQFQVIAGNEVNEMYAELVKMGVPNDDTDTSQKPAEKKDIGDLCPPLHILVGIQDFTECFEVLPILHHIISQPQ